MTETTPSTDLGHGLDYADEGKNYYEWLADTFAPSLREACTGRGAGTIVEHGAGTGLLSQLLLEREVRPMTLTEPDPKLARMLAEKFEGRSAVQVSPGSLEEYLAKAGDGAANGIVSSNVLEHVADDEGCLAAMWKLLRPGGVLALYVPARPELYGEFDRDVGHYRRYRRGELRDKLERAGFRIRTLKYRNLVGTLGWLLMGRILKRRAVGRGSVRIYDRVVFPITRILEDRVAPPYGLNLLTLAEKPG
jgi:SAM-dependent methyltransferase